MKYTIVQSILIALTVFISSCTMKLHDCKIYSTKTGKEISLNTLASELMDYDIVLFGEIHGHTSIHNLQKELLPIYLKEASAIVISMEMFERDAQLVVNDYLLGKIDEKRFLKASRAWHTYELDYKPIIEFAKKESVPVVAANAPRFYSNQVQKYGIEWLEELPSSERFLIAEDIHVIDNSYKDRFYSEMMATSQVLSHDHLEMMDQLGNLYAAQSLQDDTMTESILNYRHKYKDSKIIHFQGDFHSNSRLGVYTKLKMRNSNLSIAVISPVVLQSRRKTIRASTMKGVADYVIVVKE